MRAQTRLDVQSQVLAVPAFEVECPRCHHVFSTRPCTNPRNRLYAALLRHFKRIHPEMTDRQRALAASHALVRVGL